MKLGICRLYTQNNNIKYNYNKIEKFYKEATEKNLDIIIFPHLSLSGLCIENNFLDKKFIDKNIEYYKKILDLTMGEKTKILMGGLYYEEEYRENNNVYKNLLRDSVLFIDNGYIDTISSRKTIDKSNILDDYKYFDKDNILKQVIYNKKKFAILIADDIFSNFNVFLTSDNKPDYIICFDTSNRDIVFKEKHLLKLAKFANSPVFYINTANLYNELCFKGEMILINEDFEIVYNDIYKKDEIFEFEIDCEDGTELFIKNKDKIEKNNNISHLLKQSKNIVNIDNFNDKDIQDILKHKTLKCITFDKKNKYNIEYIDIRKYINVDLYNNCNKKTKKYIQNQIISILPK